MCVCMCVRACVCVCGVCVCAFIHRACVAMYVNRWLILVVCFDKCIVHSVRCLHIAAEKHDLHLSDTVL